MNSKPNELAEPITVRSYSSFRSFSTSRSLVSALECKVKNIKEIWNGLWMSLWLYDLVQMWLPKSTGVTCSILRTNQNFIIRNNFMILKSYLIWIRDTILCTKYETESKKKRKLSHRQVNDVGDGCWRQLMLVTTLRSWWPKSNQHDSWATHGPRCYMR